MTDVLSAIFAITNKNLRTKGFFYNFINMSFCIGIVFGSLIFVFKIIESLGFKSLHDY